MEFKRRIRPFGRGMAIAQETPVSNKGANMKRLHAVRFLFSSLIAVTGLMACSHDGGGGSSSLAIPEKLNFTPQKGTPLTPSDLENINAFFKDKNIQAPSLFLIKKEGYTDQREQADKRTKVSADYDKALTALASKCTIRSNEKTTSGNINPDAGQNHKREVTNSSISGDQCGVSYKEVTQVDFDLVNLDKGKRSGKIKIGVASSSAEGINDPQIQSLSGLNNSGNSVSGEMVIEAQDKSGKLFGKFQSNLSRVSADGTSLGASGPLQLLVSPSAGIEFFTHLTVTGYTQPLFVSAYGKAENGSKIVKISVYLNGDKATGAFIRGIAASQGASLPSGTTIEDDGTITVDASALKSSVNYIN
jgi:hypothetical protein